MPILFVLAIHSEHPGRHRGDDFAFSDYVTRSGLAMPLVILLFGAIWMFPLIDALVAGDIFASEDHNGTLKTVLTRSLDRQQIFAGKALAAGTYAVVGDPALRHRRGHRGLHPVGLQPLQSLSGTIVSAPKALGLVYAACCVYLLPIAAIVCIGLLLSTVTRNSAAAVVGTLMVSLLIQLIGILPGLGAAAALPAEHAVQRLAGACCGRRPIGTPIIRASWVCALYGVPRAGRGVPRVPAAGCSGRVESGAL